VGMGITQGITLRYPAEILEAQLFQRLLFQ
jgi:hypothetical protein